MYNAFFQLSQRPFEISPDPSLFYATPQHQEALAGLYYGIKAAKGFMVLTGEVGTGKTLVIRCLQELLDKNRVAYAYVFNPLLSSQQFLSYVAEDLGLSPHPTTKSDLLIGLSRLLIERHRRGLMTMLVVEEAQHLTPILLEEIRLLTNLETARGKLLQILLVGQPELEARLDSPTLRQLKHRVALWFRLHVLSEIETSDYVRCRLKLAGGKRGGIFTAAALERVYCYSQGTPRLINTLCDNAMMSAFALRNERVAPELIEDAASDLGLNRVNGNGHSAAAEARRAAAEQTDEQEVASFAAVLEDREPETHGYPQLDSPENKESK
jgi:type II secretory pathway predicted ATPase ExeA